MLLLEICVLCLLYCHPHKIQITHSLYQSVDYTRQYVIHSVEMRRFCARPQMEMAENTFAGDFCQF